jgi:hypothetical protein
MIEPKPHSEAKWTVSSGSSLVDLHHIFVQDHNTMLAMVNNQGLPFHVPSNFSGVVIFSPIVFIAFDAIMYPDFSFCISVDF